MSQPSDSLRERLIRCGCYDCSEAAQQIDTLLASLKALLLTVRSAIRAGDWMIDGACDPDSDLRRAEAAVSNASRCASALMTLDSLDALP
jgi:hypothetical protein